MRFTSIIAAVATLTTAVLGQTSEQQAALDMHNAARAELGLNPLIWDQQLAAGAQDWANHLVSVGSLEHSQTQGQGENLASQSDPQDAWRGAVRQWMDEKPKYHGEAISETNYQIFGHYSESSAESTLVLVQQLT